jgi:methyl-accepting chemotaxis protein
MKKAAVTGDISLTAEDTEVFQKCATVKDEIGECIGSTSQFISHLHDIDRSLSTVSMGDLTADIMLLSENDTVAISLKTMTDSLNNMFSDINESAALVSNGSRQVAGDTQSLARDAFEQAISIDELSNSIADIAERTKTNAAMAEDAAKLSDTIKGDAEEGSHLMDEMIAAVKEINDASNSISKIIKTIDDIAFQTNILALNAAVEAARAGSAGKGFAVVAEEVRNLASKSAEAAKNTGNMIQNSMEKATLGFHMAGETAVSLNKIASGINESTKLSTEIARASETQSQGIVQTNNRIDPVAQVVQHNSETAEKSAAASELMSGQSDMLQQLIAQFKLSNNGLPPAVNNKPKRLASPEKTGLVSSHGAAYRKY